MPLSPATLLPLAAAASALWLWVAVRLHASIDSRRRWALGMTLASLLLPGTLVALGAIDLQAGTALELGALLVAIVEAAQIRRADLKPVPSVVRHYWVAVTAACAGIATLGMLHGVGPGQSTIQALLAFAIAAYIRVDQDLLASTIVPVWTTATFAMIAVAPFDLLSSDAWRDGSLGTQSTELADAYNTPILAWFGLDDRWSGIFAHANGLGAFAAVGIGLALVARPPRTTLMLGSIVLLGLCASRGSTLAAMAGAIVYVVGRGSRRARVITLVVSLPVVAWVASSVLSDRSYATGTGRVDVWRSLPSLLGESWITGLGPNAGSELVAQGRLPPWAASLHSVWAESLLTVGILGVLAMAWVYVAALRIRPALPLTAVAIVLGALDTYMYVTIFSVGAMAYIAIAACGVPGRKPAPPAESPQENAFPEDTEVSDAAAAWQRRTDP